MRTIRTLVIGAVVAGTIAVAPSAVSADVVGVPGEPNCFGMRVSHGSSDHGLTPRARAAALQFVVYESGMVSPEEAAAFEEAFGVKDHTVTVQTFARFVKVNCSDDPFVPTP